MDYLPVALDLRNRPVLVVGGGHVALRKAQLLLRSGASVTVWAPQLCEELAQQVAAGEIRQIAQPYAAEPLDGWWLVIAATDDREVNEAVRHAADAAGRPCNVVDRRELCSFIMPAIVDRSPVLVAVSTSGSSPTLARRLRAWLEAMLPRRLGDVARFASAWRVQARDRLPEGAARRAFQEVLVAGSVADQVLAGREDLAQEQAQRLLDAMARGETSTGAGEVRIVGAGPGDAGLLTLHGLEALQWADVVLYDRLVSRAVLDLARRDAHLESVGKVPGRGFERQREINERMIALAGQGLRVVRLKGGDPTLFARLGEELEALRAAGIPVRVIPGITAAVGAAAAVGMPLTERSRAHTLVTIAAHGGHEMDRLDWQALARSGQTLAFYMGSTRAGSIRGRLLAAGALPTLPVAVIGNATTPQQVVRAGQLQDLDRLADGIPAPAVIVIGDVAALAVVREGGDGISGLAWSDAGWLGAPQDPRRPLDLPREDVD